MTGDASILARIAWICCVLLIFLIGLIAVLALGRAATVFQEIAIVGAAGALALGVFVVAFAVDRITS